MIAKLLLVEEQWFSSLNLSPDDLRKRRFLTAYILILAPLTLIFGLYNLQREGWTVTTLLCLVGASTGLLYITALRYSVNIVTVLRFAMAYTLVMLTTILAVGGGSGLGYGWFYFFPLIAYYIFGTREGSVWVVLSWIAAFLFGALNLGSYAYPATVGTRFVVSYSQVCLLAYGLEASRSRYYNQLLTEKRKLEESLKEVNTLQSLLPICASCKNIRDDSGYWHQVESYMQQHAGMEFSHGLCPECRDRLYPSLGRQTTTAPLTESTAVKQG